MSEKGRGQISQRVTDIEIQAQSTLSSWTWKSYLFLSLFHLLHAGLFIFGWLINTKGPPMPGLSRLKSSIHISRGAAVPLSLDLLVILLPMCRITTTQLRLFLRWIPLEEGAWFHRQVAYTMLFYTVVHTASHYVNLYFIDKWQLRPERAMQIHYTQAAGITGHVMIFCMVIIYTFSHEKIRKHSFEAFQWGHKLCFVFLIAAWTHGSGCFVRNSVEPYDIFDRKEYWAHCVGYQSWRWETWFSVLYCLERVYAHWYVQRRTNVSKVLQHPSNTLEIQFDRLDMDYKAGQWVYIKCPAVSKYEWHPFSISSCPYDSYVSVHIRQVGDFTKTLRDTFEHKLERAAYDIENEVEDRRTTSIIHARLQHQENPKIIVEGPYGSPAEDIFGHEVAILIGAGIGVTPWASVLKSLWHMRHPQFAKTGNQLRRVEFIWTCKDLTMFEWFQNLISSLNAQSQALEDSDKSIRLTCHTYITRPQLSQRNQPGTSGALNKYAAARHTQSTLQDMLRQTNTLTRANQHNRIHSGRPDFNEIFSKIGNSLEEGMDLHTLQRTMRRRNRVAVNFCGPKGMARDIREACKRNNTREIKFCFKKESF